MDIIDGRTKALILKHEIDYDESFDFRQRLSWSSDGQYLVITVRSAQYKNNSSIWVIDLNGNTQRLTDEKANDFQPIWQPLLAIPK